MSGRELSTASTSVTSDEFVMSQAIFPMAFFKQRLADLIMHSNIPPVPSPN